MDKNEVFEAVKAASVAPFQAGRASGCGRAYVVVSKEFAKDVSAACSKLGLTFLKKAYGTTGNAIYVGYDNSDGRALAKAAAMAKVLNERGVRCWDDAVED